VKPLDVAKHWISEDRDQDGLEKHFVSSEIFKMMISENIGCLKKYVQNNFLHLKQNLAGSLYYQ
jgi:hypothetical protein